MIAAFRRKLWNVHLRCQVNLLGEQLALVAAVAGALAVLAAAGEKVFAVRYLIAWAWIGLGAAAMAATLVLWWFKRPTRMAAAVLIDQRLGLRERFSTALALSKDGDPFAVAACRDAYETAERVELGRHFPIRFSRKYMAAISAWVIFSAIAVFVPEIDLLGLGQDRRQKQAEADQLVAAKEKVQETVSSVQSRVEQLANPELGKDLAELAELAGKLDADDVKREAIRKLGELEDKLEKMAGDEKMEAMKELENLLKRLRPSPNDTINQLSQALAQGNYSEAAKTIEQVQKDLAEGKLSEEQKKDLQEKMEALSRQLADLAEQKKAMEELVEKAGLDKQMASASEDKLREALKERGLSEEQIDQLMDQLSACKNAGQQARQLSESLSEACQGGLQPGGLDELADSLAELARQGGQLELIEGALEEVEGAIARLGEGDGEGGMPGEGEGNGLVFDPNADGGKGKWLVGLSDKQGAGTGGPGKGSGPVDSGPDEPVAYQNTGVKNDASSGPITASSYFKGPQVKGEAKKEFREVARAAKDRASEAITENRIPRSCQPAVKKYFSDLESRAEGESGTEGAPPKKD